MGPAGQQLTGQTLTGVAGATPVTPTTNAFPLSPRMEKGGGLNQAELAGGLEDPGV